MAARAAIDELNIYPLKSARGIPRSQARLTATGLEWDRHWMVIRESGAFLTQRTHPALATIATAITHESLVLETDDCAPLILPLEPRGSVRPVKIWKHSCRALDQGGAAAAWASAILGEPVRIVRVPAASDRTANPEHAGPTPAPLAFPDSYPIHICNRSSLDDLNRRLREALPMARFRPNLVLDGLPPFAEDHIAALSIGPITLRLVKPCTRCIIPSIDQRSGLRSVDPLPVLRKYRFDRTRHGILFGMYALIAQGVGETLARGAECLVG